LKVGLESLKHVGYLLQFISDPKSTIQRQKSDPSVSLKEKKEIPPCQIVRERHNIHCVEKPQQYHYYANLCIKLEMALRVARFALITKLSTTYQALLSEKNLD